MHIDCDRCVARGPVCAGCVVSVLLGPPADVEWDDTEQAALATLARFGLVPPLRLDTAGPGRTALENSAFDDAVWGNTASGTAAAGNGPRLLRCGANHIKATAS